LLLGFATLLFAFSDRISRWLRKRLATEGDYRSANVAKNFVSSLNGLAATIVFATQGAVLWPQTLALAAGTIGGGLVGAYVARIIPRNIIRVLIVVVGATLTVAFARRYWFGS
jgi:uncharacterized membrane protein YfcA